MTLVRDKYSEEDFFSEECLLSSATVNSFQPNIVPNLKARLCKKVKVYKFV